MSAIVDPLSRVDPSARLGEGVQVGPFCVVGPNVTLGARTRLISHVSITGSVTLGEDCLVYPFAVLGHPPQDFKYAGEDTRLIIGARNVIREHATMHPGTAVGRGETRIGEDGYFMVGAHVAHDCIVGNRVTMVNNATLGGHVTVGDHVIFGGLSAVHQYCRIGRQAFIGGLAAVVTDVIPFGMVHGNHARLTGLNLVGLKRRGFSREAIHDLRAAYRLLFAAEGTLQERLVDVAELYANNAQVQEIITFIRTGENRALCLPGPD